MSNRVPHAVATVLVAVLLALPARAQQKPAPAPPTPAPAHTGRITGRALTRDGAPVAYAYVNVLGTRQGAQTDEAGNFVVPGVPVGEHQVRLVAQGYDPLVRTVRVDAGVAAVVIFTLGAEKVVTTVEVFEVRGDRILDRGSSQAKSSFGGEKFRELPVDNLAAAVATKAGVVVEGGELHVRGSRGSEVKLQLDGVEATDPGFGGSAGIASLAVAGADLLSGGFDAEFGGALSGIISVTTREGDRRRFGGEVRWDTDRYGDPTKTFDNFDRFTFGFGGPTPVKNLTYFATYEGTFQDTYLRSTLSRPTRTLLDFVRLGNRQSNQVNTNLKFAWYADRANKVTFEAIQNRTLNTPYHHVWSRRGYVQVLHDTTRAPGQPDRVTPRYGSWSPTALDSTYQFMNMPDHVPTTDDRFRQLTLAWTNQVSDKSVWTTRLSSLVFEQLRSVGRKAPWEYDTQSPFYWSGNTVFGSENNFYYATHGDFPVYVRRRTDIYNLKTDFATRRWDHHAWKTGLEAKYNRIENLTLTAPNSESNGLPGGTRSSFVNFNPEGAVYVQDRWEFEGLTLNAGLRFDVFSPGEQVALADLRSGQRYKQQFSPRLGIAYPVSDRDALSFYYGWTFQTPNRAFVFENRGLGSSVVTRGNPDLGSETNVSYQASLQHLFSKDVSATFGVFFKDIYGQLTTRQERDESGTLVSTWFNGDYASARGFEASIAKAFSHKFSADLSYSYSIATGVASDPNSALQFFNGGQLYLPISERALDWDQRHTLNLNATVRDAGKWGFRLLWSYGSGFPFTPVFRADRRPDPALDNSRRRPSAARLTVDGDKFYRVWGQNVTLFVDARNILDSRNIADLSPGTGGNPFLNSASRDDYANYYTETGRAGGAYLQDVNGDNVLDWVPVNDPRVFEEGRAVRMGVSVRF